MDVIIFAGARNNGQLKDISNVHYETLINLKGCPMITYIIDAVRQAQKTEHLAIVGPREELVSLVPRGVEIFPPQKSMLKSVEYGLKKFTHSRGQKVLLMTADIPLIRSEILDEFIDFTIQKKADLFYPVISKAKIQAQFPEIERTYVNLKEGVFTGGNLIITAPSVLLDSLSLVKSILQGRKKPWKLAQLLGIKFIFKYIFNFLSITEIESRFSSLTSYDLKTVTVDQPEICFDIDKPLDLEIVMENI